MAPRWLKWSWISSVPRIEAQAAGISLVVSVTLLTIKFVAYFITHSSAVFSDAVESIANVMGATMAFYALVVAHTPADDEHPYGHGKIEFLSAMFEGSLVLLAAVFIFLRTTDALWNGEFVRDQQLDTGLWLVSLALLVNGGVGWYLIRTGKKQGSMTLEADGKHLMSDAITSVAVLVALGLVKLTGWYYLDPLTALGIGAYIAWMALGLMRRSGAGLMDRQDTEDMRLLRNLLDAHTGPAGAEPRICGYHKLRHRHSGRYHWVDFHILVPAEWTIGYAHAVAGAVEGEIERALGEGNATAHVEPCSAEECPHCINPDGGHRPPA
jgi:cation diffusion facilitator family transporter